MLRYSLAHLTEKLIYKHIHRLNHQLAKIKKYCDTSNEFRSTEESQLLLKSPNSIRSRIKDLESEALRHSGTDVPVR